MAAEQDQIAPTATEVRRLRERLGMSLAGFAAWFGVEASTVEYWEKNESYRLPSWRAARFYELAATLASPSEPAPQMRQKGAQLAAPGWTYRAPAPSTPQQPSRPHPRDHEQVLFYHPAEGEWWAVATDIALRIRPDQLSAGFTPIAALVLDRAVVWEPVPPGLGEPIATYTVDHRQFVSVLHLHDAPVPTPVEEPAVNWDSQNRSGAWKALANGTKGGGAIT